MQPLITIPLTFEDFAMARQMYKPTRESADLFRSLEEYEDEPPNSSSNFADNGNDGSNYSNEEIVEDENEHSGEIDSDDNDPRWESDDE